MEPVLTACGRLLLWGWESLYPLLVGARPIPGGSGVLHWVAGRHRGADVQLADGRCVHSGAPILKLHVANVNTHRTLRRAGNGYAWAASAAIRQDLRALAHAADAGLLPEFASLWGLTLFGPAARRYGFEIHPVPDTVIYRLLGTWQRALRAAFHPTRRLRRRSGQQLPSVPWMSREALLARYRA